MAKVMLKTSYPTIEETARMLGISAEERDAILASIRPKADGSRGAFVAIQDAKPSGGLGLGLKPSASRRLKPGSDTAGGSARARRGSKTLLKTARRQTKA